MTNYKWWEINAFSLPVDILQLTNVYFRGTGSICERSQLNKFRFFHLKGIEVKPVPLSKCTLLTFLENIFKEGA